MVKKSFSLIEVLIFISVLSLFFVAALSVTTFNIKNMKIQEHKILAVKYAEEAIEWLKQEKEDEWFTFIARAGSSQNYCLNGLNWGSTGACGENYILGAPSIFKRDLSIVNSGTPVNQVSAVVTVAWKEGDIDFNVPIKTVFKTIE